MAKATKTKAAKKGTNADIYHEVEVTSTGLAKTGHAKGVKFKVHPSVAAKLEDAGKVKITGKVEENPIVP